MKRILITGTNSYIGTSFENYVKQWPEEYYVDTVDMIDGSWREKSFAGYDVIFHVAGIAHVKETMKNTVQYYKINRDLAIEMASKAKEDGVKQFIFVSSMSIYGMDTGVITKETVPKTNYGRLKLQTENETSGLQSESFIVVVLRPPMIYGKLQGKLSKCRAFSQGFRHIPQTEQPQEYALYRKICANLYGCLWCILFHRTSNTQIASWIAEALNRKLHISPCAGLVGGWRSHFSPCCEDVRFSGLCKYRGF